MAFVDSCRLGRSELPTRFPLDFDDFAEEDLRKEVVSRLQAEHLAYVKGFPISSEEFSRFLIQFGLPLPNYNSTLASTEAKPEDIINRVCFRNGKAEFGFQAEGPLPIHTARSWRMPPPSLFCMLMIDKGDQRQGFSGASHLLRFRDVLIWLNETRGSSYEQSICQLTNTNITLPAKKVPEPAPLAPIVFSLGSHDPFDLGIRFRADIEEVAKPQLSTLSESSNYWEALSHLVGAVKTCGALYEFQMEPGDLVVVDNRRFGHGRSTAQRLRPDGTVNSREIWSATIE